MNRYPKIVGRSKPDRQLSESKFPQSERSVIFSNSELSPMELATLQDLYFHELKDLYSAEKQLIKALPKMAEAANNAKLAAGFREHLKQQRGTPNDWNKSYSVISSRRVEPDVREWKASSLRELK